MAQEIDTNAYTTPFILTKSTHRDPYPAILPSNPSNTQKGKIILITGGGSGIGAAAALVWARASAAGIVLTGRRVDRLDKVASEIRAINSETTVLTVKSDMSNDADVKNLFQKTQETFGRAPDVLLLNHGVLEENAPIGETPADAWWSYLSINLKGIYSAIYHYVNSQADPSNPTGTIITVNSGLAGLIDTGISAYSIGKLAGQRLNEYVDATYPNLRIFTTMPGVVATDMPSEKFAPFCLDHADLTGMLALYLSQPRADYLRGSMISVNWDVEEMEEHKEEIKEKGLLKLSWLPILPIGGGKGLGN